MVMKKNMSREKCNGGGVIVFYKKWLNPYFVIMKCCVDCMIHFTQHSLKHIISFSHTNLRNSPSANFLIIPFEIFQEHTLRTLFTLPF
jgi:hypothetical protein